MHNALEAARIADVPFVLLLSTPTATLPRTVFGRQFFAIEKAAASCGIPFAILRAPMFTDDMLLVAGNPELRHDVSQSDLRVSLAACRRDKETVRTQAKFYGVLDPDAKHSTVRLPSESSCMFANCDRHFTPCPPGAARPAGGGV